MNKIEFKQFLQNTKDNIQEKLNPKKIGTKISVSLKSKKTRKNLIIYAFLTLFCIAFLLLLSASTSPLYKDLCDGDSSIFIFFGKAITLGKDAYRDYFDHKGPILFYINALGYFLTKSKVGVFILQCISLSISSIFMYKTARFFTKPIRITFITEQCYSFRFGNSHVESLVELIIIFHQEFYHFIICRKE